MGFGQYSGQVRPADESRPQKKQTKRLRHVFDNPAHVWAHPVKKDGSGFEQTDARVASGTWYFKTDSDGTRIIYSYRDSYPIGSRFELGRRIIFLLRSGEPYSVTTNGHMSATLGAVPASDKGVEVFSVPYVMDYDVSQILNAGHHYGQAYPRSGKPGKSVHKANLKDYVSRINELIERHIKARSSYIIRTTFKSAQELTAEVKRYAKTSKLKLPALSKLPKLDTVKLADIVKREQAREAKQTAKRKAEREAYEAKKREKAPAWKRGENVCFRTYDGNALLRVVLKGDNADDTDPDGYFVETSQGVSVPVSGRIGAARLFRFLTSCKDADRPYQRNGHTEHIGNFTVESFKPELNGKEEVEGVEYPWILTAGCHRILWSEVLSISREVLAAEESELQSEAKRQHAEENDIPQS